MASINFAWIVGGLATAPVLYYYLKRKLKDYIFEHATILHDIPLAGTPRKGEKIPGTAVICGGSIAGLLAARICSDHFEDVLIIEAESWLATDEGVVLPYREDQLQNETYKPRFRTRVMQYGSAHASQALSLIVFRRLFPKFDEVVKESGGRIMPRNSQLHNSGVREVAEGLEPPLEDFPGGGCPPTYVGSRESLETILRRFIRQPNSTIRWMAGTVIGLQLSDSIQNELKSVTVRLEGDNGIETRSIDAALVLDCTGSSQASQKWLSRLSSDDDKQTRNIHRMHYNPAIRIVDFIFPVPPEMRDRLPFPNAYDELSWIHGCTVPLLQPRRSFGVFWLDGHRIDVVLGSYGNGELPTHPEELCSWLESLPLEGKHPEWLIPGVSMLCENIDEAFTKIQSGIECSWLRYDLAQDLPCNFVAIGDAVMRLNPIYGQGIVKSCMDCITLDRILRRISLEKESHLPRVFSSVYCKVQRSRIEGLWNGTKAYDYSIESTIPAEGESKDSGRWLLQYMMLLGTLRRQSDKLVVKVGWYMANYLVPGIYVFQPRIVMKVLLLILRQRLGMI